MKTARPLVRIVACGRGRVVQSPKALAEVVRLTTKPVADINLLYLGTAAFEDAAAFTAQTLGFSAAGVGAIEKLCLTRAEHTPSEEERRRWIVDWADAIIVSGGNTLAAMERWRELGVDLLLCEAAAKGTVMAGGSAGAIVWFSGGHSDSMDPATMLDADLDALDAHALAGWSYIRVEGLGIVPRAVTLCPHHDTRQSNGLLRCDDFDEMLLRGTSAGWAGDVGICLEDQAILVVEGDAYTCLASGMSQLASIPARVYLKEVVGGTVVATELTSGSIAADWR